MKLCPKCNTQWDDFKRFCPYDGTFLPSLAHPPVESTAEPTNSTSDFRTSQIGYASDQPQLAGLPSEGAPVLGMTGVPAPVSVSAATTSAQTPSPASPSPPLWTTDDTPTVKASHPHAVWPASYQPGQTPREGVPAIPVDDDQLFPLQEASAPNSGPITRETPTAPVTAPEMPFTPGAWGGDSPEDVGFLFDATHQAPNPDAVPTTPASPLPGQSSGGIIHRDLEATAKAPPADIPKTVSVFEVAREARDRMRRSQSMPALVEPSRPKRTHAEYFQLLNERNRIIQQFVEVLVKQGFSYKSSYSNKDDHLIYRFDLSFGDADDHRTFPVSVALHRKPSYSVLVSIDLFEIGRTLPERTKRTELIGGKVERTDHGMYFHIDATEDLPNEYLMQWLDENLKSIFRITYEN
ncbi:MAG: hypothetical protein HY774_15535 [Acidobacteria bacterium]|nr:hypothetical protein [Acidobacteriota bacterium]